jgi:hypothetical protein
MNKIKRRHLAWIFLSCVYLALVTGVAVWLICGLLEAASGKI